MSDQLEIKKMAELSEFQNLLENSVDERVIQKFLETYPWIVSFGIAHRGVSIISQFRLGSEFVADFAFLRHVTGGPFLNLVEIERPSLKIFTKSNEFSAEFNHAIQQILDWSQWCDQNMNYLQSTVSQCGGSIKTSMPFRDADGLNKPRFWLVAGRRKQIETHVQQERWKSKIENLHRRIEIMTFDRILSNAQDFVESLKSHPEFHYGDSASCVGFGAAKSVWRR